MCKIVFLTFHASRVNKNGRPSGLQRILFIFPRRAKRRFCLTLLREWAMRYRTRLFRNIHGAELRSIAIQT